MFMELYGEQLFRYSIGLIIAVMVIAVVFIILYSVKSASLKKQLEKEYGKKNGDVG